MNYKITRSKLDRVLKSYWKKKFEKSFFGTDGEWYGIIRKNPNGDINQLVVQKEDTKIKDSWFYNGEYFYDNHEFLGLDFNDWLESFKRFLRTEYNMEIETLH